MLWTLGIFLTPTTLQSLLQYPSLLFLRAEHSSEAAPPLVTPTMNTSAKLIPPQPADVMVIKQLTPNISTLSVPFSRFGRIYIGGRATLGMVFAGFMRLRV